MLFQKHFVSCITRATTRSIVSTCTSKNTILKLSSIVSKIKPLFLETCDYSPVMQHKDVNGATTWEPFDVFHCPAECKYAIVVLNTPIEWKENILLDIWEKAQVRLTINGGTNRWLDYLKEQGIDLLNSKHLKYVPDLITGDMDSVTAVALQRLKDIGSEILITPDQSHTDYTKGLFQLSRFIQMHNINITKVYVLAEICGRFDHIVANINTLYKTDKFLDGIQVIQVANNSLTWLLRPGFHKIPIPEILVKKQSSCGLIPFGSSVTDISTTGLKWNLNNSSMQFGGLISTSNTYDEKCTEVTVVTDTPVVWTMDFQYVRESIRDRGTI